MKITMYELLGLVKDGKAPKKIKYDGTIYEYSENDDFYYWEGLSLYREFATNGNCLDNEVEIIEEPKKIEYPILHKTAPSETTGDQMPNWRNLIDCNFEYLNKTICQLIDEINNLKEK